MLNFGELWCLIPFIVFSCEKIPKQNCLVKEILPFGGGHSPRPPLNLPLDSYDYKHDFGLFLSLSYDFGLFLQNDQGPKTTLR